MEGRASSLRWALGAALLCSLLAMLGTPWARLPHCGAEMLDQGSAVLGAAQSMAESGLPLREIPHTQLRDCPGLERYPFFQFYSQLPMMAGGALVLLGLNPCHAVALLAWLAFFMGFLGMRALGLKAGASPQAALLAAALFTLAPYHLTDWHARAALSESVAFAILPWVAAATWGLLLRASWGSFFGASLAWALLLHTHPLFHVLGLGFMAALALGLAWQQGEWKGLLCAAAAYAAGLALSLWFLAPGMLLGGKMLVSGTFHAQEQAGLTPLWVLFCPWRAQAAACTTDKLGLQVGLLLWAGWLAALLLAQSRRNALLLLLGGASLLLAWAPFRAWDRLGPLDIVQFPYRLLVLVCLAGALPAAEGWLALAQRSRLLLPALALLALALVADYNFAAPSHWTCQQAWPEPMRQKAMLQNDAFALNPGLAWGDALKVGRLRSLAGASLQVSDAKGSARLAAGGPWGPESLRLEAAGEGAVLLLPCFWYPGMYDVRINGAPAPYGRAGVRLAVRLPAGASELSWRFTGLGWANWLSGLAWLAWLAGLLGLIFGRARAKEGRP